MGEHTSVATMEAYLEKRQRVLQQLKEKLALVQNRIKQSADKKRSKREFNMGERVYLKLKQAHLKAIVKGHVNKLSPKYYEPYEIEAKVGKVAYRL